MVLPIGTRLDWNAQGGVLHISFGGFPRASASMAFQEWLMSTENLRREFLKRAGAGLAGTGLAFQAGQGMAHAAASPPSAGSFDARTFGATGDGKTLDSPAIDKAIDAASAAGGGTVM